MISIDKEQFRAAVLSGYANLENNKQYVNDLNVFPVPDGDTGTNMALTMQYAVKSVTESKATGLDDLISACANGALMGARGNSGVILSQLFRGFSKACMGHSDLDIALIADAMESATKMAYKAVMKPTEGTILSVARGMSEYAVANRAKYDNPVELFSAAIERGREVLAQTPEMLPVLKEAGVVDSGGAGLVIIMEGMLSAMKGKAVVLKGADSEDAAPEGNAANGFDYTLDFAVITDGKKAYQNSIIDKLMKPGMSINVMEKNSVVKVHLLTSEPWHILKMASAFGSLRKISITDNTDEPFLDFQDDAQAPVYSAEHTDYVIISVSSGAGLTEIMKDLGVTYVVEGGQTMNPSTQDFMEIIDATDADNYIILPNNKNIILAAQQTRDISSKNVAVVESKNIPQAISAMISFDPEGTLEDNVESMTEAMNGVSVGQVTFAVRDTSVGGTEIHEGDIIAFIGSDIVACEQNVFSAVTELVKELVNDDTSILSLYYGSEVDETDVMVLQNKLKKTYPDIEVEVFNGGQPLYYYIISAE